MLIDKEKVSAVGEDLTSVNSIFPGIPPALIVTVKHLFLSNNLLTTLQGIEKFTNVQIISASNNRLVYLDSLEALFTLKNLKRLSLLGNPITKLPFYRDHVIALCEKVDSLDGVTVSDLDRVQSKLRYRHSRQCFRRAMDNVARNSIARHILLTLYCHHEMRKKVFNRMRFLHHKSVGPLAVDPPKPIQCDTSLLFRLLRENGVLDDFLVAGREISIELQNELYKIVIEQLPQLKREIMASVDHSRGARSQPPDLHELIYHRLLQQQEVEWVNILQKFSDLSNMLGIGNGYNPADSSRGRRDEHESDYDDDYVDQNSDGNYYNRSRQETEEANSLMINIKDSDLHRIGKSMNHGNHSDGTHHSIEPTFNKRSIDKQPTKVPVPRPRNHSPEQHPPQKSRASNIALPRDEGPSERTLQLQEEYQRLLSTKSSKGRGHGDGGARDTSPTSLNIHVPMRRNRVRVQSRAVDAPDHSPPPPPPPSYPHSHSPSDSTREIVRSSFEKITMPTDGHNYYQETPDLEPISRNRADENAPFLSSTSLPEQQSDPDGDDSLSMENAYFDLNNDNPQDTSFTMNRRPSKTREAPGYSFGMNEDPRRPPSIIAPGMTPQPNQLQIPLHHNERQDDSRQRLHAFPRTFDQIEPSPLSMSSPISRHKPATHNNNINRRSFEAYTEEPPYIPAIGKSQHGNLGNFQQVPSQPVLHHIVPQELNSMAFSQVSRSLEMKKSNIPLDESILFGETQNIHRNQRSDHPLPTAPFRLDNADVFSFIATAKSSAIDDVCDDLAETFFQSWDDCTIRIKTIVQTMEEIHPSRAGLFSLINEQTLPTESEKNIINNPHASIAEYKNVIQSLSRKLVIIQRDQHDAQKVSLDLQTEYQKCQTILENVANTSAKNLLQLGEQVTKFKSSYNKAFSWIQEAERVDKELQMAKDQLDKIHRHCQKVADITKQCQDEEKIEHQYMQEIDDNIHSIEQSMIELQNEKQHLLYHRTSWQWRYATKYPTRQHSRIIFDALCLENMSLLRKVFVAWGRIVFNQRLVTVTQRCAKKSRFRLLTQVYRAWKRYSRAITVGKKFTKVIERKLALKIWKQMKKLTEQSQRILVACKKFALFRKQRMFHRFVEGVHELAQLSSEKKTHSTYVNLFKVVRLVRGWKRLTHTNRVEEVIKTVQLQTISKRMYWAKVLTAYKAQIADAETRCHQVNEFLSRNRLQTRFLQWLAITATTRKKFLNKIRSIYYNRLKGFAFKRYRIRKSILRAVCDERGVDIEVIVRRRDAQRYRYHNMRHPHPLLASDENAVDQLTGRTRGIESLSIVAQDTMMRQCLFRRVFRRWRGKFIHNTSRRCRRSMRLGRWHFLRRNFRLFRRQISDFRLYRLFQNDAEDDDDLGTAYVTGVAMGTLRFPVRSAKVGISNTKTMRLVNTYLKDRVNKRRLQGTFNRWRFIYNEFQKIREVIEEQKLIDQQRKDYKMQLPFSPVHAPTAMSLRILNSSSTEKNPSETEVLKQESGEASVDSDVHSDQSIQRKAFQVWQDEWQEVQQLSKLEIQCAALHKSQILSRYFKMFSTKFVQSLFEKTRRLYNHPVVIFYNDRERYAREMESRKRYHDQAVVSLRHGIMEKEIRVEELRVAVAAIEDSGSTVIPSASISSFVPTMMYSSRLSLQDVEHSVVTAQSERDNLLKSLAAVRQETSDIKMHIESMQKDIGVKDPMVEQSTVEESFDAILNNDTMVVKEGDLQLMLDLKHLQVERDFRIKQLDNYGDIKADQQAKIKQQLEKLHNFQQKLIEKQRSMDQLYGDRMHIQELLYQSQILLQNAFDKVANEMKIYENEFDIIAEERQACMDVINRCQSEEKRCRLMIEHIGSLQKKQVMVEEVARKIKVDRTRVETKLFQQASLASPMALAGVSSSRIAPNQLSHLVHENTINRSSNTSTFSLSSQTNGQIDQTVLHKSVLGSSKFPTALGISTISISQTPKQTNNEGFPNNVTEQIESLSKRLKDRLGST